MKIPTPSHAPDFPALMTPAPPLDAWPPVLPEPRDTYRVSGIGKEGVSWTSAAIGFQIPDVLDLIWYNFWTIDPRKVNFYMHRYIGCWQSNDGKNFSFKNASPGIIYIPPRGYKRLPKVVADALSAMVTHYPYIAYKGIHIDQTYLLGIVRGLRSGRFEIRFDETLPRDVPAAYTFDEIFWLGPGSSEPSINLSLTFVHEATHAIFDLQKVVFKRWEYELVAFLAEALCKISGGFLERPLKIPMKAEALGRHILKDKAGKTFIHLDDYIDTKPFIDLKDEIKSAHPREWRKTIRGNGT